ncbi:MAG: DNA translocase FtsK 4TM domain-containing protein [Shimia sp.]
MAYPTRGREPLLDQTTAAALEKRGRELIGLALIALGLMAAMMVASYAPDDPNWLVATDAPIQNWMGRLGASLAAPMFMVIGWASWGIPVMLLAWGARVLMHHGAERALTRVIFAPIAIALAAIFAATLAPGAGWTHSFGLGGLFGDTVLMMVLQIVPGSAALGAKMLGLLFGLATLALGLYVTGFTRHEVWRFVRWMLVGLVVLYATLMRFTSRWRDAGGAVRARMAQPVVRAPVQHSEDDLARVANVIRAQRAEAPAPAPTPVVEEEPKRAPIGLGFLKRSEPAVEAPAAPTQQERLQSKILKAISLKKPGTAPIEDEQVIDVDDPVQSMILSAIKKKGHRTSPDPIAPRTPEGAAALRGAFVPAAPEADALPKEPVLTRAAAPLTVTSMSVGEAAPQAMTAPVAEALPQETLPQPPAVSAPAMLQPQAAPVPLPQAEPRKLNLARRNPAPAPSRQAKAEAQPALAFDPQGPAYEAPPLSLLRSPDTVTRHVLSDQALEENARMLESVLDDYGVKGEIVSVRPGPVVTMYELEPAPGLKASRVIGLADDIARSMSALSARVSTVPGRSVIGIELPNDNREMVVLREILAARDFGDGKQSLPLALGKDIGGDPVVANLAKMPHLLIAGTTGSGKSVAINTMILSLLYKLTPEECRLIMIDPKMLELSVYDGIPHLLSPVVTDPKKAVVALKWVVGEMEERYRKMSKMGVRNIEGYNGRVKDALAKNETFSRTVQTGFDDETGEPVWETEEITPERLPYIVVVVDEMADLMMVAGKEIEACIQRLAQMARASGIHLIMATQRPSVDVITGTIKANFPTRISFQVTSKVDSRTILGEMGAEQLLGQGDMLYMAGGGKITRVHGPFCSDEEVEEVVQALKAYGPPEYVGGVVEGPEEDKASNIDAVLGLDTGGNTNGEDALYDQAVAIVIQDRKCSTSYIQRKLGIGYNKAARLVEQMEDEGVVSPANHVGKREILVPEQH